MKDKRPIHLNLMTIKFPVTAITSIMHRLSGVFVYLMLPILLWCLQNSLASSDQFAEMKSIFNQPALKILLLITVWSVLYHLLAGVKHLMMDLGYWETKQSGPMASKILLVIFALLMVGTGILLW